MHSYFCLGCVLQGAVISSREMDSPRCLSRMVGKEKNIFCCWVHKERALWCAVVAKLKWEMEWWLYVVGFTRRGFCLGFVGINV